MAFLSKIFNKSDEAVSAKTKYDTVKKTKKENFTFLNKNYCNKNQTVLAGDSITEIYNHTEFFEDYTKRTGLTVYNRGISGDTSDRLFERFEENVLSICPKNLVILIGTNDLGYGAAPEFTVKNVRKILDLTKEKCPNTNVLLLGVYPINYNQGKRSNKDIKAINSMLKPLAEEKGVSYLDISDKLSDSTGKLNPKLTYDGLHLNAHGFEVVTNNIISFL